MATELQAADLLVMHAARKADAGQMTPTAAAASTALAPIRHALIVHPIEVMVYFWDIRGAHVRRAQRNSKVLKM